MGVTREPRDGGAAALTAVPSSSAARSAAAAAAASAAASSSHSASASRKVKDRGARFNEKHALKYGLSICSRNAKDQSVEVVMCKFCVAFGKESASAVPRKRRATANIKYFRVFRADHYLSHLEINHKTKWSEYEHATMPEKELFFAANADPAGLAPQSVDGSGDPSLRNGELPATDAATQESLATGETTTETAAAAAVARVVPVRLPASELEKDVVEKLIGELFFNSHEEDGVTREHALELFVRKADSPNYEIVIKNQRLYDLAIKFVANGASYRLASRLVYCVREETKLAHYGGCTDVRVANYVRAVLASNLQRLAWMLRAAWTYCIATETVVHQRTTYLDVRVRLWHNSGLRDFHLFAVPQVDAVAPPRVIERLGAVLDILDPRWRAKLLGTTAHGGIFTGREPRGLTSQQQGLAARLTGLVTKPHFYLVWSAVHQLEVVAKNAVTAFADQTFYDELVAVVQMVRRAPVDETALPNKHELSSLPAAHASPRGFVQTVLTALRWLLRNRASVSTLLASPTRAASAGGGGGTATTSPPTAAWWVCAAAAQRLLAEVEFFIHKLTELDAPDNESSGPHTSVHDHVLELGKLTLVLKDVVGATRDFVDFHQSTPLYETGAAVVAQGSFILSLANAEQFLQNEGGSVAIEMLDLVTHALERTQLARSVAAFAVDLLASVAAVAHEGRHYCAESAQIVVTPPRVMPYDVYHMGKDAFLALVASQFERLRETFTPQEIRKIQNEYFFFLAAVETEPILSGVLKTHGRDTDVSFAWSCLNSRFLFLQEFVGGLASVVPDAMSGTLHAELLYLNWEKPDYQLTSVDFALEGILHARQKMQIEVVDVNHLRAALRNSSLASGGVQDDPRRPAVAIDTATPAGGSVLDSLASAEEVDDPMDGGHAENDVDASGTAAETAPGSPDAEESKRAASKKPTRLGEGYTIV